MPEDKTDRTGDGQTGDRGPRTPTARLTFWIVVAVVLALALFAWIQLVERGGV